MSANGTVPNAEPEVNGGSSKLSTPQSRSGWDGKLRVNKQATLANPEALSDPDYSDEDAPPVDQIEADEGTWSDTTPYRRYEWLTVADLLDGEDFDSEARATLNQYQGQMLTG